MTQWEQILSWAVACCCAVSISLKLRHHLQTIPLALPNREIENVKSKILVLKSWKWKVSYNICPEKIIKTAFSEISRTECRNSKRELRKGRTIHQGMLDFWEYAGKRTKTTSLPPGLPLSQLIFEIHFQSEQTQCLSLSWEDHLPAVPPCNYCQVHFFQWKNRNFWLKFLASRQNKSVERWNIFITGKVTKGVKKNKRECLFTKTDRVNFKFQCQSVQKGRKWKLRKHYCEKY